ncbi:alpha/beta hydrolase [Amycolatopsis endophytica]|uniref:Pimeloyl-ACP methyl ester carboxylesterase n=1 Tax=Amycolatopsis endophytica TaxID=860233 RepID=A0A853B1U7_9PSEU|nr:alpha/beta hydrolase [Amycolatopsis endophytica]NYI88751.1 pimeloyl-ACP methyl ester carboxylesterase [Amycolatopsis endophytica]
MIQAVALASALLLTPVTAPAAPALTWQDCASPQTAQRLECADLPVPGATLRLVRLPALDPAHRVGSLLVNPGGPGGSGADVVAYGGLGLATPEFAEVNQRFDVVGFDPRGVGGSSPAIECGPVHDPAISRFPADDAGYQRLVAHNRAVGLSCTGPRRADTGTVAEDVERIRLALGEDRISWFGASYGTEIGALYAARYPEHVRAMVLDGAIDHALPMRRAILDEAAATERGLLRFAQWCTTNCGEDVLARYDALMTTGAPSKQLGRQATPEELAAGVYTYLYFPQLWPQLADALRDAPRDASALTSAMPFVTAEYPAYRTVGCQDFPSPFTGAADLRRMAEKVRQVAPHSWRYSEFWDFAAGCTGWPAPAANPPHPEPVRGAPPILVVGGAHDPATPLAWARSLASRIEDSTLLTYDEDGHTGVYNSACVRRHEAAYLISGTPGTTPQTRSLPCQEG